MEMLTDRINRFLLKNSGYGDGDVYGSGYGYGYGYGSGYGDGDGYGSGDGIKIFCGEPVYMIDGVQTIVRSVHGRYAKGSIMNSDLTLMPCFIAKGGNCFAHGRTLKEALAALQEKLFVNMPEEERVQAFIEAHPAKDAKAPARDLWEWHHRLTGSCEMGRNQFASDRGIDIDKDSFTPMEFCEMCKDSYGGEVIKALMEAYEEAQ